MALSLTRIIVHNKNTPFSNSGASSKPIVICLPVCQKFETAPQILHQIVTLKALPEFYSNQEHATDNSCHTIQASDSAHFLSLVLQIFLRLETFECNTTSDWLNHTV